MLSTPAVLLYRSSPTARHYLLMQIQPPATSTQIAALNQQAAPPCADSMASALLEWLEVLNHWVGMPGPEFSLPLAQIPFLQHNAAFKLYTSSHQGLSMF